jgi:nitronate monooxygenase
VIFDLTLPIIQAPLAGVQGSAMAIAVSNAGGMGSLPCAMLSHEGLKSELAAISAGTRNPYNVNFFCHTVPTPEPAREERWREVLAPYFAEYGIDPATIPAGPGRNPFTHEAADVLEAFRPPVVSFHFGLPSDDLLQRVRAWGAQVLSSATTVDEARWLEARGVDAIIAQGVEAGGHRGMFLTANLDEQLPMRTLFLRIQRAVKCPVIAAGGLSGSPQVAAAMAIGAALAQVGTSYLLCDEAYTSSIHRLALTVEPPLETKLTNLFTGRPARALVNRLMRELGALNTAAPTFPLATAALAPLRAAAERVGCGDFSPLWSGQDRSGCAEIPAAALTVALARDVGQR